MIVFETKQFYRNFIIVTMIHMNEHIQLNMNHIFYVVYSKEQ